jgi:hypothetical protein
MRPFVLNRPAATERWSLGGVKEAMHKNLTAAVLGVNGLILLTVGAFIASSAQSQLAEFGLGADQIARTVPTFYGLGLADASASLFSLLAMVQVYRQRPSGRTLALAVAANQLTVGVGLFLLASFPPALYFIALRGVMIAALAWPLPRQSA